MKKLMRAFKVNRENRIERIKAVYYGTRMAFLDSDKAVDAVRGGSTRKFETACADREVARTRMFDAARKLDGEIDYE